MMHSKQTSTELLPISFINKKLWCLGFFKLFFRSCLFDSLHNVIESCRNESFVTSRVYICVCVSIQLNHLSWIRLPYWHETCRIQPFETTWSKQHTNRSLYKYRDLLPVRSGWIWTGNRIDMTHSFISFFLVLYSRHKISLDMERLSPPIDSQRTGLSIRLGCLVEVKALGSWCLLPKCTQDNCPSRVFSHHFPWGFPVQRGLSHCQTDCQT